MASLPKTYKAWVVESKNAPLTLTERELQQPAAGQVLIKTIACGVCFTDVAVQRGELGDVFPRVPGHEIVGDVVALGEGVKEFQIGDRVGGAWHGGHDNVCRACRRGQFQVCENAVYNGASRDGGYAEYTTLRSEATVRIPKDMDPASVAPLLCAGITVFNGIRKMHIEQGNLVVVQGLGGLGHMAVQYAHKMGYKVAVLSTSDSKKEFALNLGANYFINTSTDDPVKRLKELGGAALIVATAPTARTVTPLTAGLAEEGRILLLAPAGPIEINTNDLIMGLRTAQGWLTGNALDAEETVDFSKHFDVNCMIEKFPFLEAPKAVEHMVAGNVRFRGVLMFE